MEIKKSDDSLEQQPSALSVKDIFGYDFPIQELQNKISLAEQISCCVLKRMESNISQRVKLVCSKQKCPFSIKLELSSMGDRYSLREIQDNHNHGISADKFEEKMLTGRLLKYSDFIFNTYFLTDSEFSSKPKLILKDLKQTHGIDLLAGDFNQPQKQKLKKKFDNIIQQLRLKRSKQIGINNSNDQSQQIQGISLAKQQSQQIPKNNIMFPHLQINSSTSLQNTLQKDTNNIPQSFNVDPSTAASMASQKVLQSTQTLLPSTQTNLQKQMSNSSMNLNFPTNPANMSYANNPLSSFLSFQQLQDQVLQQQKQFYQQQQNLLQQQFMENNYNQQLQVLFEDSPSVSGNLCKVEELSDMSPNIDINESESKKKQYLQSSTSASNMLPTQKLSLQSNIQPFLPSSVSEFPKDDIIQPSSLNLTPEKSSQFNILFAQLLKQQQNPYLMHLQQQQQQQCAQFLTPIEQLLQKQQQNLQPNLNSIQNILGIAPQQFSNFQQLQQSHVPLIGLESSNSMNSSVQQNLLSQLCHPLQNNNSSGLFTQSLADLEMAQLRQMFIQQYEGISSNQNNILTLEQQQQLAAMIIPQK